MCIDYILFEHMANFNQVAKKFISLLAISLARLVKAKNHLLVTSVIMTQAVSSHESSYLANCRVLQVSSVA